jgi:hypothetical protein
MMQIVDLNGMLKMGNMKSSEAENAASSMKALQLALTEDLEEIEIRIDALVKDSTLPSPDPADEELKIYYAARAALYSGLSSINEVLGWVHVMAEKDSDGNVAEAVKSLPTISVFSIH